MSTLSTVSTSTLSPSPELSISFKLATDASGAESDCNNRSDDIREPLEKAMNLITTNSPGVLAMILHHDYFKPL
jgi:hypothetical protein